MKQEFKLDYDPQWYWDGLDNPSSVYWRWEKDTPDNRLLKAVYDFANQQHKGQYRNEKKQAVPYINHPLMGYDLLASSGVTDVVDLAAMMLHDTIEDGNTYNGKERSKAERLRLFEPDLVRWLKDRGISDAESKAAEITALAAQVTNETIMSEDKRFWQPSHIMEIKPRAKRIKIVDQFMSMFESYINPITGFDEDFKMRGWTKRALDVVEKAARYEGPDSPFHLREWAALTTLFANYFIEPEVPDRPPFAGIVRETFDQENMKTMVKMANAMAPKLELAGGGGKRDTFRHPNLSAMQQGCVGVTLANGCIIGFDLITNTESGKGDPVNQTAMKLVNRIEQSRDENLGRLRVSEKPSRLYGPPMRHCELIPPMPLEKFLAEAKTASSDLITPDFEKILNVQVGKAVRGRPGVLGGVHRFSINQDKAVVQVSINEKGLISEFYLKSAESGDYARQRAKLVGTLAEAAIEKERMADMGLPSVIRYEVHPPMEATEFAKAAVRAGALPRSESMKLHDLARHNPQIAQLLPRNAARG